MNQSLTFGTPHSPVNRSSDEEVNNFPSPKQVEDMLLEGTIDGIQIHVCGCYCFIKLFKGGLIVHELLDLDYQEQIALHFRTWCQHMPTQKDSVIVHDTRALGTPRKIYFKQGAKELIYVSYGISAKYNYCECFDATISEDRKQITLEGKVKGSIMPLIRN